MSIIQEATDLAYMKKHSITLSKRILKMFTLKKVYAFQRGILRLQQEGDMPIGKILQPLKDEEYVRKGNKRWFLKSLKFYGFRGDARKALKVEDLTRKYIGICLDPDLINANEMVYTVWFEDKEGGALSKQHEIKFENKPLNLFKMGLSLNSQYSKYKYKIPLAIIHKDTNAVKYVEMSYLKDKFKAPKQLMYNIKDHNVYNNNTLERHISLNNIAVLLEDGAKISGGLPDYISEMIKDAIAKDSNNVVGIFNNPKG